MKRFLIAALTAVTLTTTVYADGGIMTRRHAPTAAGQDDTGHDQADRIPQFAVTADSRKIVIKIFERPTTTALYVDMPGRFVPQRDAEFSPQGLAGVHFETTRDGQQLAEVNMPAEFVKGVGERLTICMFFEDNADGRRDRAPRCLYLDNENGRLAQLRAGNIGPAGGPCLALEPQRCATHNAGRRMPKWLR